MEEEVGGVQEIAPLRELLNGYPPVLEDSRGAVDVGDGALAGGGGGEAGVEGADAGAERRSGGGVGAGAGSR